MPAKHTRRGVFLVLLAITTLGVFVAGCGSSSSTSSSSTGTSGSAASSAGQTEAKKVVEEHMKTPPLGLTAKVAKPIPTGKRVDFVTCGTAACREQPEAFKEAARVLGWNAKNVNAGTSPEELQNAMTQALRDKPDGVIYNGLPSSIISRQLQALKEAKIPVVALSVTTPSSPGYISIPDEKFYKSIGEQAGALAASGIKPGSEVVILNLPELPIFTERYTPAIEAGLKKYCPDCKTSKLDIKLTAIGKSAAGEIVSYLQGHSGVNAVITGSDNIFIGLPAAMKGASIKGVKLFGVYPVAATLPYIAGGEESGSVQVSFPESAWMVADGFARYFNGESTKPTEEAGFPTKIVTASDLPSSSELKAAIPNYKELFKALWGK
jgi:ribose transport system substrate-binding protein